VRGKFVAYYRVSTEQQGRSGLGLEAQRKAVLDYLNGGRWKLLGEHTEIESGKRTDRPALAEAMRTCKLLGATLVIAKLDRLSRDAHFLLGLDKAGVDFVCADMPEANRLTIGLLAVVAQHEREQISARTKAALAAAKARGVKLGGVRPNQRPLDHRLGTAALQRAADEFAAQVAPVVTELRGDGMSLRQIAAELSRRGVRTMRGGVWTAAAVRNVLQRMAVRLPPKKLAGVAVREHA
jgi:DNA invertase Pin-like site-specific DNA recombinase